MQVTQNEIKKHHGWLLRHNLLVESAE